MFYTIKPPWIIKKVYSSLIWQLPATDKTLYLTFDDGPHIKATPFVLNELREYNAKATFFCVGRNVEKNQNLYNRILDEGHRTANHTQDHLNGWKTADKQYVENILKASKFIDSNLFRPPYGKITRSQIKLLQQSSQHRIKYNIIMWSLLSGDFDPGLTPQECLKNVLRHARPGYIIVFHDSSKAWNKMSYVLPKMLDHFSKLGYVFRHLKEDC